MKNLEQILEGLIENCGKLTPAQVIIGQKEHARRINKNYPIPEYIQKYRHESTFIKMACLLKGRCVIVIDGKTYALKPGDICVIRPGVYYFESYYKENTGYELVWLFYINVRHLKVNYTAYDPEAGWKLLASLTFKTRAEKYFILETIFTPGKKRQPPLNIRARLKEWFLYLREKIAKKEFTAINFTGAYSRALALKEKRLTKAITYVENHYREDISLKEVAQQVSLSRAYFSSLFAEVYNHALFEYVAVLRLNEAYSLIHNTGLSINEIAYKVGYHDPAFFRRIFKKYTGVSPVKLREKEFAP